MELDTPRPLPRGRQDGEEASGSQDTPFLSGTQGSTPGFDLMPEPAPRSAARRPGCSKREVEIDMIKKIQKWGERNERKGPPGGEEVMFHEEELRRYEAITGLAG